MSLRIAEEVDRAVIVMIFPDRGDRYLSEPFWNGGDEVESTWTGSNSATVERDGTRDFTLWDGATFLLRKR